MMIMARNCDYEDLVTELKGRNVMIWTCSTCARLCYDLGGRSSAERLSERLTDDGVHVTGVEVTSASCIESKLIAVNIPEGTEMILSLTCGLGADCIDRIFSVPVLNPITTFGCGILSEKDGPVLMVMDDENEIRRTPLSVLCGMPRSTMPFVR